MSNENTAVVKKQATPLEKLSMNVKSTLAASLEKNSSGLGDGFNKDRFTQNSIVFIRDLSKNPNFNITEIQPVDIVATLLKGAYLELDFMSGECYAIPYGKELNFQTSYKGERKLALKFGKPKIKNIYAKAVKHGDEFIEEITAGKQSIIFRPDSFSDQKIKGVFAVAEYADGSMIYETMSVNEVESVRNSYSKAKNSKAWEKSWEEMAKKTVLRRLCKHIELDFNSADQLSAWNDGSDFEFKDGGNFSSAQQKKNEPKKAASSLDNMINITPTKGTEHDDCNDDDNEANPYQSELL